MALYNFVLWNCLAIAWASSSSPPSQNCLTGTMTDVQSWVDQDGHLTEKDSSSSLDVSESPQPVTALQEHLQLLTRRIEPVRYMSLAKCRFREVPEVFTLLDGMDRLLSDTVEYLTLYGNKFDDHQSTGDRYDSYINATQARTISHGLRYDTRGASWPLGFVGVHFKNLRELDLRACSITTLGGGIFKGMQSLEVLYLSDNNILFINAKAFAGLRNLSHLDLSKNYDVDEFGNHKSLLVESVDVMEDLENLTSLDFSYTRLSQTNLLMFSKFGKKFQRLSLCETGLTKLRVNLFANTTLRYLDVSGNNGILNHFDALAGTEKTLEVLYAAKIGLKSLKVFERFKRLEILNVQWNEISAVTADVARTLESLQVLDLDGNRLSSWFNPVFQVMPRLKYLSMRHNNINMMNEVMLQDFENINYIAMAENFVICNCYVRDFFNLALKSEQEHNDTIIETAYKIRGSHFSKFHTAFRKYNDFIVNRRNVSEACLADESCDMDIYDNETISGFLLVDYDPSVYQCMQVVDAKHVPLSTIVNCNSTFRDLDYTDVIKDSRNKLLVLIILPGVLFPILIFVYWYRRNFRYFCITLRNSALLSMINNDKVIDDSRIFNYDVFVSYCNDDRGWILDQLLPHLETNCGVSVCLHERDFQVGLSILENIVSCMDRSRSIMLIISREFLLSQWCQFEMHLAQHRLLETRREDLILVLLEEIPRHLRPTTLHYLMLTKTYVVYPSEGGDSTKKEFWKRLGRSVAARRPDNENDSLA